MSDSGQKVPGLAHGRKTKKHGDHMMQTNAGTFGAVAAPSPHRSQGHRKGGRHGRLTKFR